MIVEFGDIARLPPQWRSTPETLRDRVVLIVGAAGALGQATALAAAAAGARTILLGRKPRALEKVYDRIDAVRPATAAIYPLDLAGATSQDYANLAASIEREFGRLDGIMFAAAHFEGLQPAIDIQPDAWLRALHVNLSAPFLLVQACADLLHRSAQSGACEASVVFTLDDAARVGKAFWGGYGVAKHALAGLVSTLHEEWESAPVRVHALLPAPMRSMLRRTAYFGENTLDLPNADAAAQAVVYLLGADAQSARGRVLDLR
jgi:NAD(P)-dependent dehydrogenase (short-subunit alcohol dehydrogenase family)